MTATLPAATVADDAIAKIFGRDANALANPVPLYHAMRESAPVHRREESYGVAWHLTRYDDIAFALKDPRFSAERSFNDPQMRAHLTDAGRERAEEFARYASRWLIAIDPPDHTRLRGLVLKAFTPRVVESLRPRIEGIVDELLNDAATRGEMDVMHDFAYPLPATVIAELLGVPVADRDRFKRWSDSLINVQSFDDEGAHRDFREMVDYLRDAVHARANADLTSDLLTALVHAREERDALSEDELIAQAMLLLVAGHETTTNLIGNGLLALFRHPEQLRRLRDDPTLLPNATEELLRYDGPVQLTSRTAKAEIELRGTRIAAGSPVILWLGAANHDPARFVNPDALDLARPDAKGHLAFAHGIHFCVGAALARMEGQIALGALLHRFPDVRPAADTDLATPEWGPNPALRGLLHLPVTLA